MIARWQWLIAAGVLLALLLFAVFTHSYAQPRPASFYEGLQLDAKLLALDKEALDEAYHLHLVKLWTIWVTDGAPAAGRIQSGLRIARRAYDEARDVIAKREQQLQQQKP